jgi:hypothetical protein
VYCNRIFMRSFSKNTKISPLSFTDVHQSFVHRTFLDVSFLGSVFSHVCVFHS